MTSVTLDPIIQTSDQLAPWTINLVFGQWDIALLVPPSKLVGRCCRAAPISPPSATLKTSTLNHLKSL
jgi:hypothetical protein